MPIPPAFFFLIFRLWSYWALLSCFLALSSSEDKTIVYSVDGMVVDKAVDGIVVNKAVDGIVVDEEVDGRAVKQGVFEQVLLAGKSVMGLNYVGY